MKHLKPWMQALLWLGLGGGIGFFAGIRRGYNNGFDAGLEAMREASEPVEADPDAPQAGTDEKHGDIPGVERHTFYTSDEEALLAAGSKMIAEALKEYNPLLAAGQDEDPDMPMDVPEMPDDGLGEDYDTIIDPQTVIPDAHPQNLVPHPITEFEFNENKNGYDIVDLIYYADDDAVYDPEYDEEMTQPDQLLGYGWFARFSPTVDTIYIENDTMGNIYRVVYRHGSIKDDP